MIYTDPWSINILQIFKNKGQEGKINLFQWEGVGTRKGGVRVNMVVVFGINI
jgi:hypothetical protein